MHTQTARKNTTLTVAKPKGLLAAWLSGKPANKQDAVAATARTLINHKDAYCIDRATD